MGYYYHTTPEPNLEPPDYDEGPLLSEEPGDPFTAWGSAHDPNGKQVGYNLGNEYDAVAFISFATLDELVADYLGQCCFICKNEAELYYNQVGFCRGCWDVIHSLRFFRDLKAGDQFTVLHNGTVPLVKDPPIPDNNQVATNAYALNGLYRVYIPPDSLIHPCPHRSQNEQTD